MRLYYGKELRGAIYNAAKIICAYLNQEFDVKSLTHQEYRARVGTSTDRTNTVYGITNDLYQETSYKHGLYSALRGGYLGETEYVCGCIDNKMLFVTPSDAVILTQWSDYISDYEDAIIPVRANVNQTYNDTSATHNEKIAAVQALIKQETHLAQLKKRYDKLQEEHTGGSAIDSTVTFGMLGAGNYYTSSRDGKYHILVLSAEGTFNKNTVNWQSIGQIGISDEFKLNGKFKRYYSSSDQDIECGFLISTASQDTISCKITFSQDLWYYVTFTIEAEGAFPGGFSEQSALFSEYNYCWGYNNGGAYYMNLDSTSTYSNPLSTERVTTSTTPIETVSSETPWEYYNSFIKDEIDNTNYRVFPNGYSGD